MPDFERTVQYADAELTREINQICENLTEKLQQRIQAERQKPFTVEKKLELKKKEIKDTVKKWLDEAAVEIKSQKVEKEAARKKDEEKVEEDYQAAVCAVEADYEKRWLSGNRQRLLIQHNTLPLWKSSQNYKKKLHSWNRKRHS